MTDLSKLARAARAAADAPSLNVLDNAYSGLRWDGENLVAEEPRLSPSGKTNAQEIEARLAQKSDSRDTRVRRMDPKTGEWISTRSEPVQNDRAQLLFTMLVQGGPAGRNLAIRAFNALPADQQARLLTLIADAYPNPRSNTGWSPVGRELAEALVSGTPLSQERARVVDEVMRASAAPPTQRGNIGREAVEDGGVGYDDTPAISEDYSGEALSELAPGDLAAITEGTRAPGIPDAVDRSKIRAHLDKNRPYLREPNSTTHFVLDDMGFPTPVRALEEGTGAVGPQDFPSWRQADKRQADMEANDARLTAALAQRYGGQERFSQMVRQAVQSGDKEALDALLKDVAEVRKSIEQQPVAPAPYPVNDINAANSLRSEMQVNTDNISRLASGDLGPADKVWDMLRGKKNKALSPNSPESGFSSPEQLADTLLSGAFHDPDRLPPGPAFETYRQGLVDTLRKRFYEDTPSVKLDPEATVIDETGNPAALQEVRVKTGRDPRPENMTPAQLEEFRRATKDVDKYPGARGKETADFEGFGTPRVLGVPTAANPAEMADQLKQARRNWALYRLQNGKVVYRDPETGSMTAAMITDRMKPERIAYIRSLAPKGSTPEDLARFNTLWPEGGFPTPEYFNDIVRRADGIEFETPQSSPLLDMSDDQLRAVQQDPEQAGIHAEAQRILAARKMKGSQAVFNRGTFAPDARPVSVNRTADFDDLQLKLARDEWRKYTGMEAEVPPGFIQRPDGKIVPSAFGFEGDETFDANEAWSKAGGANWDENDVPFTSDNPPRNVAEQPPLAEDPGPGPGIEVGVNDSPVVGDSSPTLESVLQIIKDRGSSTEMLRMARDFYKAARDHIATIADPDHRAAFKARVLDVLDAAAAERRAAPEAAPKPPLNPSGSLLDNDDYVMGSGSAPEEAALEAAATPIEPENIPGTNATVPPERTPEVQANENADVQKAASDIEGEKADVAAKADAEGSADEAEGTVEPAAVPQKRGIVGRAIDTVQAAPRHLWRNKWRYGLAGGALAAYQQVANQSPYAPGEEPLTVGGPGSMDTAPRAASPEDRIRQVIRSRMQQELIPHTQSRYY